MEKIGAGFFSEVYKVRRISDRRNSGWRPFLGNGGENCGSICERNIERNFDKYFCERNAHYIHLEYNKCVYLKLNN